MREIGAVQTMQAAGRSADHLPDHLLTALTKDYSGLMENLDNRSRNPGLGGMNSGLPVGPQLRMNEDFDKVVEVIQRGAPVK